MKIYSLIQEDYEYKPVEVEVRFVNGNAKTELIGRADSLIKESIPKIQTAIKRSAFSLPTASNTIINLRPNSIRKSSGGLDLAIALAILWEKGELPKPQTDKVLVYGELSLDGTIHFPKELGLLNCLPEGFDEVYTGRSVVGLKFKSLQVDSLKEANLWEEKPANEELLKQCPPRIDPIYIRKDLADLVACIVIGEHPAIFAGPKGSGKSTLVDNIAKLIRPPREEEISVLQKIAFYFGNELSWRPIVRPHHTTTPIAMIGGGAQAIPGEFTRAHGGVLIMDEFLEFPQKVQEALREPMETGTVAVARIGHRKEHPAKFMLLATSNLCPCGDFYPKVDHNCMCRLSTRRNYLEKLSGPVLDRFHVLNYADNWTEGEEVFLPDLVDRLNQLSHQSLNTNHQRPNSKLEYAELKTYLADNNLEKSLQTKRVSRRRVLASLQLAKSYMEYCSATKIESKHLEWAMRHSWKSFEQFRYAVSKNL
ncbi:MAG: ATP-binding protein [Bdellovibrionales bacterium]